MKIKLWPISIITFLIGIGPLMGQVSTRHSYPHPQQEKHQYSAEKIEQWLKWEFEKNPANKKSKFNREKQDFLSNYLCIPEEISSIVGDLGSSEYLPFKNLLQEEIGGRKFFKFLLNPEDTQYSEEIKNYLESSPFPIMMKGFLPGKLSASRSCLLYPREKMNFLPFFYKASTNITGGNWTKDKKMDSVQVKESLLTSQLDRTVYDQFKFKHLITLQEPIGIFIKDKNIDQGFTIRSLERLDLNKKFYLPAFSALDSEEGARIAATNFQDEYSSIPSFFWLKHLVRPLGKAYAEFVATHGLTYDSAHAQQFLVELDNRNRPTGKIVFRDMADTDAIKSFFHHQKGQNFLKEWQKKSTRENMKILFGLFFGSGVPKWLNKWQAHYWVSEFYNSFEQKFSEITTIPKEILQANVRIDKKASFQHYISKDYKVGNHPHWNKWINAAECFSGHEQMDNGFLCADIFDCYYGKNFYSRSGYLCSDIELALFATTEQSKRILSQIQPSLIDENYHCHNYHPLQDENLYPSSFMALVKNFFFK